MTTTAERMAEILPQGFDALERADLEGAMAVFEATSHPDCEFTSAVGSQIEGGTYRGFDGVRGWFRDMLETVEVTYRNREFRVVSDDILLLLAELDLRGRESGAVVTQKIGMVFEYEEGLMRKGRSYTSQAVAMAAAEAFHA